MIKSIRFLMNIGILAVLFAGSTADQEDIHKTC